PAERERGAAPFVRVEADGAARGFDDLLHEGEADARALHLVARLQRLEDDEHLLVIARRDARPVVLDAEEPAVPRVLGADAHAAGVLAVVVLDGVADEVEKDLVEAEPL